MNSMVRTKDIHLSQRRQPTKYPHRKELQNIILDKIGGGKHVLVRGFVKSGKTTLLKQTLNALKDQGFAHFIDLQNLPFLD